MSGSFSGAHWWFLAVPVMSVAYDVVCVGALRSWMQEPAERFDGDLEPVSFFRPLKRGVPDLRGKLEMLVSTTRAQDQIILGVELDSAEEAVCEEIRQEYPERDIAVARCVGGPAVNPKISKLVQMERVARHPAWLLSDSEVILPDGFLDAFRREWQVRGGAALTAGYRFVNLLSWPQRCDALHVLLTLWPGLALVRRYGQVSFTLGACTLLRRDALAAIGGWKAFGTDLGEDQRIGAALVGAGQKVHLSRHVATLDSDAMSWREYWRHQRRVAVTYRAGNPAGFAGMIVTYGPVWSLIALLICPGPGFGMVSLISLLVRVWRVGRTMRLVKFAVPGMVAVLGVTSLVEALCWAWSWFPTRVWWSGRWWRVDFRGRFSREAPAEE
jgi:ceramide glucosyltransferase